MERSHYDYAIYGDAGLLVLWMPIVCLHHVDDGLTFYRSDAPGSQRASVSSGTLTF
jgi:hypothetical protein